MKKYLALLIVALIAMLIALPLIATAADPPEATPGAEIVEIIPEDSPTVQTATEDAQETEPGGIAGFLSWSALATYAGALAFVLAVTQFTKGLAVIDRLPTQIWSWIVALIGMYPAYYFTGQLTPETAALVPINALLVALAANGSYEGLARAFKTA